MEHPVRIDAERSRRDGPRAPRELKGQVLAFKRGRVVESARDLFFAKGFEATTLRDIALDLNVNKPFLYALYPNKREILAAVCELGLNAALAALDEALAREASLQDKLDAVVRNVTATVISHRKSFVVYQRDEMNLPHAARRRLQNQRARFDRRVGELVGRGYRDGVLLAGPPGIAEETTGALLLWVASWYSPEQTSESAAIDYMVGFFKRAAGALHAEP